MKRNPPQKLSPLQLNRLWRAVALLTVLGLAWLLFSPGTGLLSVFSTRSELQKLKAETAELSRENAVLEAEINKMKNDPAYLEEVARRDFGLLKPNERVFDFSRPERDEKE
jgi:cell division protein FtsB